jgi:SPP1 family predicted phage head-tail adaptor
MFFGGLRKRITVLQNTPAQDGSGAPIENWAPYITVWGSISPLTGRELMAAEQVQANISHTVILRWPGTSYAFDSSMRLLYKGRYFDIQAVINLDERNRTLQLTCTERVGEQ